MRVRASHSEHLGPSSVDTKNRPSEISARARGLRRETAGGYLKAAGLAGRPAGRWGHPPKPAKEVSTDPAPPASAVSTDPETPAAALVGGWLVVNFPAEECATSFSHTNRDTT